MVTLPQFEYGDAVRVTRSLRNDGTYPGRARGELLIRSGSIGYVRDVGTFLQDQIVYAVHFVEAGGCLVGCRETELIAAAAPWVSSQFEVRDKVHTRRALAINGQVVLQAGAMGQIERVIRDQPQGIFYHVRFEERVFQIAETGLTAAEEPFCTADAPV